MAMEILAFFLFISIQLPVDVWGQQMTDVTYNEIRMLNATCGEEDSCAELFKDANLEGWDQLYLRRCKCTPDCVRYDTCCVDSPHRVRSMSPTSNRNPPVECIKIGYWERPHFLVTRCRPGWRGRRSVIRMCQQDYGSASPRDPYVMIPASDNKNNAYRNYFCGLCNGVAPQNLTVWDFYLNGAYNGSYENVNSNTFFDELLYDDLSKKWGLMRNINGTSQFKAVQIELSSLDSSTQCISDLISECAPTWTDQKVRDQCKAYMAAAFYYPKSGSDKALRFRNVHCAICNFVNLQEGDFRCGNIQYPSDDPLSFSLLVDVNLRDGLLVGKVRKCKSGERYDVFSKKCRALECGLPGYTIQGNRCVRA